MARWRVAARGQFHDLILVSIGVTQYTQGGYIIYVGRLYYIIYNIVTDRQVLSRFILDTYPFNDEYRQRRNKHNHSRASRCKTSSTLSNAVIGQGGAYVGSWKGPPLWPRSCVSFWLIYNIEFRGTCSAHGQSRGGSIGRRRQSESHRIQYARLHRQRHRHDAL